MKNNPESEATTTPLVTYATIEQLNDEISTRATNDAAILNNLNSFRTTTNNNLDTKQNITDDSLDTPIKTVPGSINQLNTNIIKQETKITNLEADVTNNTSNITTLQTEVESNTANISSNTNAINQNISDISNLQADVTNNSTNITTLQTQVETNTNEISDLQANMSDTGNQLALKQNITDDNLETTDKTVAGSINEINTNVIAQEANITNLENQIATNTTNITNNTTAITTLEEEVTNNSNNITTLQTQVEANTTDISDLQANMSDTENQIALKQDIIDESLQTTDKTIPGSINELNIKKVNTIDFSIFQEIMLQFQDFTNDALAQKQNILEPTLETINDLIPEAINELNEKINANTEAIRQLTTGMSAWTKVGRSTNAKTWNYNLVINKRYRLAYNWSTSDTTSKIYKEFLWTGNTISLETYNEISNFVDLNVGGVNITVLESVNTLEIAAVSNGIRIVTKAGTSNAGIILGLEQAL